MANTGDRYNIDYVFTYANFCNANGIKEPGTALINKWASDLENGLRYNTPVDELMKFFVIGDEHREDLERKNYQIMPALVKSNDPVRQNMIITISLVFNE